MSFKRGIRFKFAVFIGAFIVALMAVDALWNVQLQQQQAENEAREKAEVLADEMHAMWDFIDINQNTINRTEDGAFRTKALVCVVTAKSVSTLFTMNTDYKIQYTSPTPRQAANAPDEFEQRAFEAFGADAALEAYYDVGYDAEGRRVFRYAEPLYVTETCLECHGEPVGELDQFGYEKEGMQVGDIGGAVSITEPMDIYADGMRTSVLQQVFMVLLVLVLACVGIYFAVSKLVLHPLDALGRAAKQIGAGDFSYQLEARTVGGPDELTEFADDFDKMARQLERLYTDLESEVRSQTDKLSALNDLLLYQKVELKKALDRLSEETAYKNEFFAIMSHELRTPLTSILAFIDLMADSVPRADELVRKQLEEIDKNGRILLEMVDNVLETARIQAGSERLNLELVDLSDVVGMVEASSLSLAAKKRIALATRVAGDVPLILSDWEKVRRILVNLVSNAIKFTPEEGSVSVDVRFDEGARLVVIEVADDGIGIPADKQELIFERFAQENMSTVRRYGGSGLGLSLVKDLAAMLGGAVSLESRVGEGSVFRVVLPADGGTEGEDE